MSEIRESPDGYKWHFGGNETDDHLALGGHERDLYPIMRSLCDGNRGYVNIGAHVGTWAIRMAKYVRYVIAFEANPLTAIILEQNVELNNTTNVKVIPRAVWNTDGVQVHLIDVNNKPTGGSTRAEVCSEPVEANNLISARTITLDYAFATVYPTVGFISMDVEGAEAKVLEGARELLLTARPNLLIELHDGHPGTDPDLRQQVYRLLDSYNYSYTSLNVCPPEEHLLCYPAENYIALDDANPS